MAFLTVSQAAQAMGVARTTIDRHVKDGTLRTTRMQKGKLGIDVDELSRVFGKEHDRSAEKPQSSVLSHRPITAEKPEQGMARQRHALIDTLRTPASSEPPAVADDPAPVDVLRHSVGVLERESEILKQKASGLEHENEALQRNMSTLERENALLRQELEAARQRETRLLDMLQQQVSTPPPKSLLGRLWEEALKASLPPPGPKP